MLIKKSWNEFRSTGLPVFVNSFLHIFGWVIVFEVDKDTKEVTECYPARTRFRGFSEDDQSEAYQSVSQYMKNNGDVLCQEAAE